MMMKNLCILILCFLSFNSFAHAPHDVISDFLMVTDNNSEYFYVISRSSLYRKSKDNSFKRIVTGLDNTQHLKRLTMTVVGKKILFLTSAGDGVYVSYDLGDSWEKSNSGLSNLELKLIESSKYTPGLVLTAGISSGLFYSTNNGKTWQEFEGFKSKRITAICESHEGFFLSDNQNGIYLIDFKTLKFKKITQLDSRYGGINSLTSLHTSANKKELHIGTDIGAFRLTSTEGYSMETLDGFPKGKIIDIQSSLSDKSNKTIYVLDAYKGFYKSTDGGLTFNHDSKGLSTNSQADIYNVPDFSKIGVFKQTGNEAIYICGFDGLFRHKPDGGWIQEETLSKNLIVGLHVSPYFLTDSTVVALTYLNGPAISIDGGKNWNKKLSASIITENLLSEGKIRSQDSYITGNNAELWLTTLKNMYVLDFLNKKWDIHPICKENQAISRLFTSKSKNNNNTNAGCSGVNWIFPIDGSDNIVVCSKYGELLIYDPMKKSITNLIHLNKILTSIDVSSTYHLDSVIVAGSSTEGIFIVKNDKILFTKDSIGNQCIVAISPAFKNDSIIFCGSTKGLFKLKNGCRTLEQTDTNINRYVNTIALSPNFESDKTILLSQKGYGLYKSTNGGNGFTRIDDPMIQKEEFAHIPFYPPNSGAIKFSGNFAVDSTIFAYSGKSVFKSVNAGLNWIRLANVELGYSNRTITFLKGAFFDLRILLKYMLLPGAVILLIGVVYFIKKRRKHYQGSSRSNNLDSR